MLQLRPQTERRIALFAASFLVLYFELNFIRWIPGQVRVIGYFTNFVLIACFFGVGLGMVTARRRFDAARWGASAILGLVLLATSFRRVIVVPQQGPSLLLEYQDARGPTVVLYLVLILFYIAIAAAFWPLGQAVGRAFGEGSALSDYVINLAGSLAGVGVFAMACAYSLPAWTWFLGGLAVFVAQHRERGWIRVATFGAAAITVLAVAAADRGTVWSPYHKIKVSPLVIESPSRTSGSESHAPIELPHEMGFNVQVNEDFYQHPVDLSDAALARYPALRPWREHYDLPFRMKPSAERVLIVGAGTGNDAAAALRNGARQVDVVDIDPEIVAIGRRGHPERPFSDPRTTIHVDDARHFFRIARPGYDLVVFGLLDSHRLIGIMSSLRLDSYVFTVESFREVRRLLAPAGIQVTAFALPHLGRRLSEMLRLAYGSEPRVGLSALGVVLATGPGIAPSDPGSIRPLERGVVLCTDDWPFFYALERTVPREYLLALGLILLASTLILWRTAGMVRWSEAHFFCLGAAFLLLETRNITAVALAFGSTWHVNTIVFASVLAMGMLSALVAGTSFRIDLRWIYFGLLSSVAVNLVVPLGSLTAFDPTSRLLLVGGMTALPVFFSGIVFAHSFRRAQDPVRALGANVLGGVLGGILEYQSMVSGLRYLLVLVGLLYLASWLTLVRQRGTEPAV